MPYPTVTGLEVIGYVVDAVPCDCAAEYATQVMVNIEGLTAPLEAEPFGEIQLYKFSLCRANHDGVTLQEICCDFGCVHLLYSVFESSGACKECFAIDPNWSDLLLFARMQIKPNFRTKAVVVRAIETVIAYLGPRSLVVAEVQRGVGIELTRAERRELGFQEVPDSPYVIRGPGLTAEHVDLSSWQHASSIRRAARRKRELSSAVHRRSTVKR